jgi:hypothetical protein
MQNELVSESFENLPLEQGIARLLAGRSFAIFHGGASTGANASRLNGLAQLWVLPGDGQSGSAFNRSTILAPGTQGTGTSSTFPQEPDPRARLAALDQLAQRRDAAAVDTLAEAMVDPDESVRAKAQAMFDQALMQAGAAPAPMSNARQ